MSCSSPWAFLEDSHFRLEVLGSFVLCASSSIGITTLFYLPIQFSAADDVKLSRT